MKKSYIIQSFLLLSVTGMISCKKSLQPKIDNSYGDEFTWSLPDKAEGVLLNAYANIPQAVNHYDGNNFLDVATDNAVTNNFGSQMYRLGAGGLTPQVNPVGDWGNAYTQFRNIHLFLENGLGNNVIYNIQDETADEQYKARLKGEAFYLRAWWGFQLLQKYGGKSSEGEALGYPIVTRTLTEDEADNNQNVVRASYEECVAQILADCDTAIALLPAQYNGGDAITGIAGLGRADKKVAHALKSRTAVYAASPANQPDRIAEITGMGLFNVNYMDAYVQKWIRAAELSRAAIQAAGNINGLNPADFNAATTPAEFIWRRFSNNRQLESQNYPPFSFGNGNTGPSQNLVDAFPMRNGYPISDARSGYDPQNPYQQRDPRLELNVLYNGATLDGRTIETFNRGKDSRELFANASRTGYYLRKWLSLDAGVLNPENPLNRYHYHALFRKTELYLNLAEAMNEAFGPLATAPGLPQTAVALIKNIRNAAGMSNHAYIDEVALEGRDAFRTLIQNERRIELSFENHRYFDMRRWVLPLNEPVSGIEITRDGNGNFSFTEKQVEQRNFNDVKYYYMPLPYTEMVKSPLLKNNAGW